jgi:hypothetical protein
LCYIKLKGDNMTQNYDALDMGELSEEKERIESQGSNANNFMENFVRMPDKEGAVLVRLLPPAKGKKFYCATRIHRMDKKNAHCTREMTNINGNKRWIDPNPKDPCPICKYYTELWKQSERLEDEKEAEKLQDAARKIKPTERYYYNCIVREEVDNDGKTQKNVGPKILSVGIKLHQKVVRAIIGDKYKKAMGDVTNFKTGRDFLIVKKMIKGEKWGNYDDSEFQESSILGEKEQIDKWLEELHDLAALRLLKPHDEMKTILKQYLGLIPSEETTFDIREYQGGNISVEDKVEDAVQQAAKEVVEDNTDDGTQLLDEDEFLETLEKATKKKA